MISISDWNAYTNEYDHSYMAVSSSSGSVFQSMSSAKVTWIVDPQHATTYANKTGVQLMDSLLALIECWNEPESADSDGLAIELEFDPDEPDENGLAREID